MATTKDSAKLATLKLSQVKESKTNPRRTFDSDAMKELIKSVIEKGVLVPPLVRAVNGSFEIVAGARRFRAAKAAKLTEIPAIVCKMNDVEALEAQVIENLQRQDVHPVEEAEGFRRLMKAAKRTVEDVAEKTGKSISYVYQRLKLADLSEASKKAFETEKISAGHAILIARLSEKDQAKAVESCTGEVWSSGRHVAATVSVRDLGRWISREIHLSISSAPWGRDERWLPGGRCSACPKLAGNSPHLYPDVKKDTCTDRTCFDQKMRAVLTRKRKELEKEGHKVVLIARHYVGEKGVLDSSGWNQLKKKTKPCETTAKGIVAYGGDRGHVVDVCTNYSCKVKGHSPSYGYSGGAGGSSSPTKAEIRAREKQADKERATKISRERVVERVASTPKKIRRAELLILAACADSPYGLWDWLPKPAGATCDHKVADFKKMTDVELVRYVLAAALSDQVDAYLGAHRLDDAAGTYKVDAAREYRDAAVRVSNERAHKNQVQRWKGLVASKKRSFDQPTCVLCGCVDSKACPGGCSWVKLNMKTNAGKCSACVKAKD